MMKLATVFGLLGALSLAPVAALAQDAAMAPAADAMSDKPVCSKDVKDSCRQGTVAERRAADEYKGGGKDNSAMMTASQADGAKKKPK